MGPIPSGDRKYMAYSPDSSDSHAIHLPSGDQAGSRSATPELCVRLRTSPFSAGTERISPCDSNSARLPVGDSATFSTCGVPTCSKRGRTCGRSAVMLTGTGCEALLPRS